MKRSFDHISRSYNASRPKVAQDLIDLVEQLTRKRKLDGGVWFEPGVGTGRFALALSKFADLYMGLDLSKPMLAQVPRDSPTNLQLKCGDWYRTGLPDDSVDVLVFASVLHLVSNVQGFFEEVFRVLKPSGVVMLFQFERLGDDAEFYNKVRYFIPRRAMHTLSPLPHYPLKTPEQQLAFLRQRSSTFTESCTPYVPTKISSMSLKEEARLGLWSELEDLSDVERSRILDEIEHEVSKLGKDYVVLDTYWRLSLFELCERCL